MQFSKLSAAEGIVANGCQCGWQADCRQITAALKGICTYLLNTLAYCQACYLTLIWEYYRRSNLVYNIRRIVYFNCTWDWQLRHVVGSYNLCYRCGLQTGVITVFQIVLRCWGLQQLTFIIILEVNPTSCRLIRSLTTYRYIYQRCLIDITREDICYREHLLKGNIRYNLLNAGTICKCIIADRGQMCGKLQLGKTGTVLEGILTDACHIIVYQLVTALLNQFTKTDTVTYRGRLDAAVCCSQNSLMANCISLCILNQIARVGHVIVWLITYIITLNDIREAKAVIIARSAIRNKQYRCVTLCKRE